MTNARIETDKLLNFSDLQVKALTINKNLTLADQKNLELVKALATNPEIILLDECMAGLTQAETDKVIGMIKQVNHNGITFLIVEHVMPVVMSICERILVLNFGELIAQGTPVEIQNNKSVIDIYLG